MFGKESEAMKSIPVQSGADVFGDLSSNGVLRFERVGSSMRGKPDMVIIDGALVLHYEDGTTVSVAA